MRTNETDAWPIQSGVLDPTTMHFGRWPPIHGVVVGFDSLTQAKSRIFFLFVKEVGLRQHSLLSDITLSGANHE